MKEKLFTKLHSIKSQKTVLLLILFFHMKHKPHIIQAHYNKPVTSFKPNEQISLTTIRTFSALLSGHLLCVAYSIQWGHQWKTRRNTPLVNTMNTHVRAVNTGWHW